MMEMLDELPERLNWGLQLILGGLGHRESALADVTRGTQPIGEAGLSWDPQPGFPGRS